MAIASISLTQVESEMNAAAPGTRERTALELYLQFLRWRHWETTVHSAPGAECLIKRRHAYIEGQCCPAKREQARRYAVWEQAAEALLPSEVFSPVNSQNWWNRLGIPYDMQADIVE